MKVIVVSIIVRTPKLAKLSTVRRNIKLYVIPLCIKKMSMKYKNFSVSRDRQHTQLQWVGKSPKRLNSSFWRRKINFCWKWKCGIFYFRILLSVLYSYFIIGFIFAFYYLFYFHISLFVLFLYFIFCYIIYFKIYLSISILKIQVLLIEILKSFVII